ncbi:SMC-Scp complex subunit ScpB [Niallia taxi]|uniref:Segregation and condensation protein B n=2 Tax=Niallia taxi TaxID=2499688 RepID=A0A437KE65_9BACI|nr:SMC-Scp complex subunit ScpB [Niallia taxi]MDE5052048.1 SMC-Scp complex subunit ScpB [Niallia taxi]MDK8639798.1 SMC-Scp complex subunit ScpB [Niallia taxi]MED3961900.1 SMC-Scp complex subunit ScpB [Niallia taxi]MED4055422.1 SMC-Scp complex subunit ScpB [Niallia taxi]MED4117613.1 SMC-Scp complex subunit ScpB [Niallia taxi]
MMVTNWKGIIESLLFAAGDEGLTVKQLAHVLNVEQFEAEQITRELMEDYGKDQDRGISIVEIAGTFQLATKKEHSVYLKKLVESPHASTLSQAALETLAIIAYKQPITRAEIEEIRGVKTERPLHTLSAKALIKEVGRAEGAGRAILYGTTKEFLDHFGLKDLDELPVLAEKEEEFKQEEADLFFESFQQLED